MKKQFFVSCFLILYICVHSFAQITIEDDVTTESVDLFSSPTQSQKSPAIAIAASLVLPGLGHRYINKRDEAFLFFGSEALLICGAFFTNLYAKTIFDNSKAFASSHANIQGGVGADSKYWETIALYEDSDGYMRVIDLERGADNPYLAENLLWNWEDGAQSRYKKIRENGRHFRIASTFLLGGLVLNRVVSFIHIRALINRGAHIGTTSSVSIDPEIALDLKTMQIRMNLQF